MDIKYIAGKYYRVQGTLMFKRSKISSEQLGKYMEDFSKQDSSLVYYGIREIDPKDVIHMDLLFLIPKSEVSESRQLYSRIIDEKLLDGLYRGYGNLLSGYDINSGHIDQNIYINTNFFDKK